MQQISHDVHMANKLRNFCEQYGGPNAALVTEIIQHFQSPNIGNVFLSFWGNVFQLELYKALLKYWNMIWLYEERIMALNVSDIAKKVGIDWLYFAQLLNLGK